MNPALRSAETAFRHFLDGFGEPRKAPRLLSVARRDEACGSGSLPEAHSEFTGELAAFGTLQWRVRSVEQLGWPVPEFIEFRDLYEHMARRAVTICAFNYRLYTQDQLVADFSDIRQRIRSAFEVDLLPVIPEPMFSGLDPAAAGSERTSFTVRTTVRTGLPQGTMRNFYQGFPIVEVENLQNEQIDLRPGAINYAPGYRARSGNMTAQARAEALLRAWLTPEQIADLDSHNYFHVVGGETKTRYRIRRGTQMNVFGLDKHGEKFIGYCFTPDGDLAPGDAMLAQKISLETREYQALAKANRFDAGSYMIFTGLRDVLQGVGSENVSFRGIPIRLDDWRYAVRVATIDTTEAAEPAPEQPAQDLPTFREYYDGPLEIRAGGTPGRRSRSNWTETWDRLRRRFDRRRAATVPPGR